MDRGCCCIAAGVVEQGDPPRSAYVDTWHAAHRSRPQRELRDSNAHVHNADPHSHAVVYGGLVGSHHARAAETIKSLVGRAARPFVDLRIDFAASDLFAL